MSRDYPPKRGLRHDPAPCDCCWLECEPRRNTMGWLLPCSKEMRLWVRAHMDDRGDEMGYVVEGVTP